MTMIAPHKIAPVLFTLLSLAPAAQASETIACVAINPGKASCTIAASVPNSFVSDFPTTGISYQIDATYLLTNVFGPKATAALAIVVDGVPCTSSGYDTDVPSRKMSVVASCLATLAVDTTHQIEFTGANTHATSAGISVAITPTGSF
jgi:hypothetical protein